MKERAGVMKPYYYRNRPTRKRRPRFSFCGPSLVRLKKTPVYREQHACCGNGPILTFASATLRGSMPADRLIMGVLTQAGPRARWRVPELGAYRRLQDE